MIIRKVSGLWIVERQHSGQIIFSHKSRMTCYEWMFKGINYAQISTNTTRYSSNRLDSVCNSSNSCNFTNLIRIVTDNIINNKYEINSQ